MDWHSTGPRDSHCHAVQFNSLFDRHLLREFGVERFVHHRSAFQRGEADFRRDHLRQLPNSYLFTRAKVEGL